MCTHKVGLELLLRNQRSFPGISRALLLIYQWVSVSATSKGSLTIKDVVLAYSFKTVQVSPNSTVINNGGEALHLETSWGFCFSVLQIKLTLSVVSCEGKFKHEHKYSMNTLLAELQQSFPQSNTSCAIMISWNSRIMIWWL